jgi:hypothetical protein
MSEESAANIPGFDLDLYDNAGHAFHWECMNDFSPRTTEWLFKHGWRAVRLRREMME